MKSKQNYFSVISDSLVWLVFHLGHHAFTILEINNLPDKRYDFCLIKAYGRK